MLRRNEEGEGVMRRCTKEKPCSEFLRWADEEEIAHRRTFFVS